MVAQTLIGVSHALHLRATEGKQKMPNRLIDETSPYLLQHAHNPVDWYPWGSDALDAAKAQDKPILLSVGYSACHWCHVMERESFENPAIAELMNEGFISIKVDREERPDIDSIYMTAVQTLTGQGGWPMTVFLTPDGRPYYGGTYFPPEDRGGMPAFPRVLEAMAKAYREDRGDVVRATDQLLDRMRQVSASVRSLDPLTEDVIGRAYRGIAGQFDDQHGGIGMQPKFPQPMTYEFLLRYYQRTGDQQALAMVDLTLKRMAEGGIYDQIGGGFHRYSTDTFWLVPHFEKMLYDNALLVRLYLHGFQVTGNPLYRRVVEETLDYVLREMADASGGFYSAQDADSEGVEGKFFIWRPEEIVGALGEADGSLVNRYFGVTLEGNFEGRTILHVAPDAPEAGISSDGLETVIARAKNRLREVREERIHPQRDDKILTSWNALMLAAFAEAASVLGRDDYGAVAERTARFLLTSLRRDGRLLRTYKAGKAKLNGYLEDYAFLADALLALHEQTLDQHWLEEALELGEQMSDLFWDESTGQFYDTGRDHEALILRPKDLTDNAIPSGNSMAVSVMLRLAVIAGDSDLERKAVTALRSVRAIMERAPAGAGHWLGALDFSLSAIKEIVIVGNGEAPEARALAAEVHRRYIPNRVLVGTSGDGGLLAGSPLIEGRKAVGGRPTAYVCEKYVCKLPVTEPSDLARQLSG